MRLLVSVQDPAEALLAAAGGAGFIDAKDPGRGALGGLPCETVRAIVGALRAAGHAHETSATIGDVPMHALPEILARVHAVAATGADIVKVGIEREPAAFAVLDALAATGHRIVPVFIADRGLDDDLVGHALALPFAGVMADTQDKLAGSLFDALPLPAIERFVARAKARGTMVGLAGALRLEHLPQLHALAPDFAGFRSAVCEGPRSAALSAARLAALVQASIGRPSPISSERMRASS